MLETDFTDGIYCLTLARPDKRNAINAALIMAIERAVAATPPTAGAILIGQLR
jgi:enoyl-CoA hydratase/carnithine racemase